jgi:broad-specificity NMP kinase
MTAFLITGIPGAGKTTVSHLLAQRFPRAAHIEADRLQQLIVSGGLWPDQEPHDEAMRQLELRARNTALVAESFERAGFVAVIDDIIVVRERLAIYTERLLDLRVVVLAPRVEVALERDDKRGYKRVGDRWRHLDAEQRAALTAPGIVWIESSDQAPDETVDAVLAEFP